MLESLFTAEFTRGALLTVNTIETLLVFGGVTALVRFLNKSNDTQTAQLKAMQENTALLKEILAEEKAWHQSPDTPNKNG